MRKNHKNGVSISLEFPGLGFSLSNFFTRRFTYERGPLGSINPNEIRGSHRKEQACCFAQRICPRMTALSAMKSTPERTMSRAPSCWALRQSPGCRLSPEPRPPVGASKEESTLLLLEPEVFSASFPASLPRTFPQNSTIQARASYRALSSWNELERIRRIYRISLHGRRESVLSRSRRSPRCEAPSGR